MSRFLYTRNEGSTKWLKAGKLPTEVAAPVAPVAATEPAAPIVVGGNLPAKVVGAWLYGFSGPTLDQVLDLPNNKRPNYLCAAVAQSAGAGTGRIVFNQVGSRVTLTMVNRAKGMGIPVTLLIGGGGDGGIALTNATQVNEMVNSIKSSVTQYGWSGIDWDIESTGWNVVSKMEVTRQLRAFYGPSFIIAFAPQPHTIRSTFERGYQFAVAANKEGIIDLIAPQFYDAPDWKVDSFLLTRATADLNVLRNGGISSTRLLVGAITYAQYSMGWNDPAAYLAVYRNIPELRGTMLWATMYGPLDNWAATQAFNNGVRGIV